MKVAVHYQAQLRTAAGRASTSVELPAGATLTDLIGKLVQEHDDGFRRILLDDAGRLRSSILLFVGDEQCRGQARPLRDGDVVTLLAPMAGG